MRMQRVACLIVLLMVISIQLAEAKPMTLKIGILPVLDTLPLQVAVQQGFFAEQGLEVELIPFASALERDTAMQSGALDGYFGDILNTLMLIQSGVPMRIVTVSYATMPGQRMFALVRGSKTAPDAARLEVGISQSTIIEYLLDRMRADKALAGLELTAIEVKQIPIRMQMLLAGQLEAALLPEPLATLAASEGATVLATDENLDMPLTVLCLHLDKKQAVKPFMRAYEQAVAAVNQESETFRSLMVEACRVPKPLAASFPVYRFPDPRLPTEEQIWPVQQWMLTRGLLRSLLPYASLTP